MNPQQFQQQVEQLAHIVQNPEWRPGSTVNREPVPGAPIAVDQLRPLPCACSECGLWLEQGAPRRTHVRLSQGWRSHCSGCNRVRAPGSAVYGQERVLKKRLVDQVTSNTQQQSDQGSTGS